MWPFKTRYVPSEFDLKRQKELEEENKIRYEKYQAENKARWDKYGRYAITDELSMQDLRVVISDLSEYGWDLKKVMPAHDDKFIAYLTFNYDR